MRLCAPFDVKGAMQARGLGHGLGSRKAGGLLARRRESPGWFRAGESTHVGDVTGLVEDWAVRIVETRSSAACATPPAGGSTS